MSKIGSFRPVSVVDYRAKTENGNSFMHTPARHSSVSKAMPRLGAGLTGLVVLFLAFDGITKVIRVAPVEGRGTRP